MSRIARATPTFRGKGRIVLALDRLLTSEQDAADYVVVDSVNGLARFQFDLRPWGQKFAYYYGEWEGDLVRLFRELYSGGDVIDVGSSLGLYAVCMADRVRAAAAKIAAVEPVPVNLERLRRNIALNTCADVVDIYPFAVGDAPGQLRITFDTMGGDNNAMVWAEGACAVEVHTLDHVCSTRGRPVGAIKMDVEGFEPAIIAGARETIEKHRPFLLCEFNRIGLQRYGFDMAAPWDYFRRLNYAAYRAHAGKLLAVTEPAQYQDLFFIPRERPMPAAISGGL